MPGRPQTSEAAPHYFKYIDLVSGDDPLPSLRTQLDDAEALFASIGGPQSLARYAPDKWSIRQVLNHITDVERAFAFRALWFGRGFDSPLPGYDQQIAAAGAAADRIDWERHVEEFRHVRLASISLFANMPADGWLKGGIASGHYVSVRALAYIIGGHCAHHVAIVRERYLQVR